MSIPVLFGMQLWQADEHYAATHFFEQVWGVGKCVRL
jgi:hypothetical protein